MLNFREYRLNRKRMLRWMEELASSPGRCLYLPPGLSLAEVEEALKAAGLEKVMPRLAPPAADSTTGAIFFYDDRHGDLVIPPFPLTQRVSADHYLVEPVCTILEREFTIAVILVRLGSFAIGVFQNEKLVASRVGTGNVHARHRQGGSSAHRFERHREKQMEGFFTRVCGHVREHLELRLKQIDYLIYGGTKETLLDFRRHCPFLEKLNDRTLDLRLNIREPKQAALEEAIDQVWSSRIVEWEESD